MEGKDPKAPRKGRGAVSNTEGRFEVLTRESFDDGWETLSRDQPTALVTQVTEERARSIISRNQSPDIPFEQSINPYRGCEHGCIYCYARQTHAYLGLSPGLDFETKLFMKTNAAELLDRELRKPGYLPKPITLGANTDPYQPIERQHRITRQIIEVLHDFKHPLAIITKSALVTRDLDLLEPMARNGLVKVFVSVTTLDPNLARIMEPRAATPDRRIETLQRLSAAGVPTGILASPMIPALNDRELESLLEAGVNAGARSGGYILIRLPFEVKDLFREWLVTHFPDRAEHVLALIRDMRGGKENVSRFGERMRGKGPYAEMLSQRFKVACRRLGLNRERVTLNMSHFRAPPVDRRQMALFE